MGKRVLSAAASKLESTLCFVASDAGGGKEEEEERMLLNLVFFSEGKSEGACIEFDRSKANKKTFIPSERRQSNKAFRDQKC